jgi:hypothetical protein
MYTRVKDITGLGEEMIPTAASFFQTWVQSPAAQSYVMDPTQPGYTTPAAPVSVATQDGTTLPVDTGAPSVEQMIEDVKAIPSWLKYAGLFLLVKMILR